MAYVLIGAGALVSLLTLYALARVWNMAFWRSAEEVKDYDSTLLKELTEAPRGAVMTQRRIVPVLMTAATAGMVVVSVALTVFAGPLYALASRAGENLNGPDRYVETVLPEEAR